MLDNQTSWYSNPETHDSVLFLQAKSEEQLASEKAFLEAERVWLIHRDGFAPAGLLKSQNNNAISGGNDSDLDNLEVKKVKVQLDLNGEVIEVDEDDVERANPPGYDKVEDLAQVWPLVTNSILFFWLFTIKDMCY